VGGDILRSICRTAPDGPGSHRLEKRLANVSYLDRAGAVLATAMHEERGRAAQRLVLIEAADLDVRVERETLFLGMRGVVNRAVTIKGRFPDAAVFPEPFAVVARTMSAASHVLWAAVWSGLAAAALRKAEALAAPPPAPPAGRAPGVEADVGGPRAMRLAAAGGRLYAMNALIRDACLALDGAADAPGSPLGGAVRSNSLKIHCADMLAEVVADCALAAGLGGYVEGTPESLSEVVRDSFSARIMVSSDRLAGNNAAVRRFVRDEI
jgi:acyl-CoA dehydrogenase